ncbi:hypothetical protein AMECASPLE_039127 [Ameca splendens]|uniref:Uncharacterized protein n=1 Tax=Ameca splendens TaxID=208324 RepID=A0ABV1A3S1_9TELE
MEHTETTKEHQSRREVTCCGGLITSGAPLSVRQKEVAQQAHHEPHHLRLPLGSLYVFLIREPASISWKDYGKRGRSTSAALLSMGKIQLTTNFTLSITEAMQPDSEDPVYSKGSSIFKC